MWMESEKLPGSQGRKETMYCSMDASYRGLTMRSSNESTGSMQKESKESRRSKGRSTVDKTKWSRLSKGAIGRASSSRRCVGERKNERERRAWSVERAG